jgi:proto-oncogene tyrosine-protein kinase ROS
VLAYTASGRGPLSSPKRGKTLRESASDITLLWGSQTGLYSTNTLGEDVQLLTTSPSSDTEWKTPSVISVGNHESASAYMWSLTWYETSVFFALSNGSVFYYDSRSLQHPVSVSPKPLKDSSSGLKHPKVSLLKGISYAQSIAFDYIGQRLYWSNPKQQTILRCTFTLDGSGVPSSVMSSSASRAERLQLVTMAREIAVDSFKGLLLWSTGHSLEMSRLNGYSHGTLFQTGLFSGAQIMGITLDTDQSRIYWITRSSTGSKLQRLSYNIRGAQLPMVIANYDDMTIAGPIRYFNDRLIWLQGSSEAVITDLYGQGKSTLKIGTISNITNLHVKDQSSLRYPGGLSKNRVQVNPDPVMKWSIVIGGKWNNFTIQWHPVNNTNYGKVLYEVVVNNSISRVSYIYIK